MLSLILPTPPLKLSQGKGILYFTEELVSYVGSVGKAQVKGLHPEQMSLCCTSRGKWEGVSWNRDHCANSHQKGSSGWGKASKNESPVWRDAVLVLLLVGLGLTHLSWKLLENNSGDTASRKDHWRGSGCFLSAHHISSSAVEAAGLKAGWGLSCSGFCDTGRYLLGKEWCGQASNASRWWGSSLSAQASGTSREEGKLDACSSSLTWLRASKGMIQEQEMHCPGHHLPSCGFWRPQQEVCGTTAFGGPHWGLKQLRLPKRNRRKG